MNASIGLQKPVFKLALSGHPSHLEVKEVALLRFLFKPEVNMLEFFLKSQHFFLFLFKLVLIGNVLVFFLEYHPLALLFQLVDVLCSDLTFRERLVQPFVQTLL